MKANITLSAATQETVISYQEMIKEEGIYKIDGSCFNSRILVMRNEENQLCVLHINSWGIKPIPSVISRVHSFIKTNEKIDINIHS